ncbi:conserved hypothetical protein [Thermobaculum terrenum ATCC BAA-798]|uniref:Uncharacterized protein n=1 Tax=Thermobaculum terrenum (strain ATCC BAA-798 / CCMEE 7001 / YNP1) TaxID=525904 RepID=D1CIF4_THET1|nr:hypothetical protein [Thermobaculum terrenum]ACZ43525.1 conserved hypothetical protein [Thermobaculum terrenum ATCC BAA-798]
MERVDGLELEQDLRFQRREWLVEYAGRLLLLVAFLAGLLGILGGGPLSWGQARSADGRLLVRYPRFARLETPARMSLEVDGSATRDGRFSLALPRSYLDEVDISNIVPLPSSARSEEGYTVFEFQVGRGVTRPEVIFSFQFDRAGVASGEVLLNEGSRVSLKQIVWP